MDSKFSFSKTKTKYCFYNRKYHNGVLMRILSKDFLFNYMLNPFGNNGLTCVEQINAAIVSIAIAILTCGVVHVTCLLINYIGRIRSDKSNNKKKTFNNNQNEKLNSFINKIDRQINLTMKHHIRTNQRSVILKISEEAAQDKSPREKFKFLVDQETKNGIWGDDKANHIKKNLSSLFPEKKEGFNESNQNINSLIKTIELIAKRDGVICFYEKGDTKFLGNFDICPNGVTIRGQKFTCAEAAFQWIKYTTASQQNHDVMKTDQKLNEFFTANGKQAFELRKYFDAKYPNIFVKNWLKGERDNAMWEILKAKFQQNPDYKRLLDATKEAYLLEHNPVKGRDTYWSDDHDGTGLNKLGSMLTAIRDGIPCPNPSHSDDPLLRKKHSTWANSNLSYQI